MAKKSLTRRFEDKDISNWKKVSKLETKGNLTVLIENVMNAYCKPLVEGKKNKKG